jgi:hypothetical protein
VETATAGVMTSEQARGGGKGDERAVGEVGVGEWASRVGWVSTGLGVD